MQSKPYQNNFTIESKFTPSGDQPVAISSLARGLKNGQKEIPILGTLYLEEDPKFSGPEVQFCGRQKHFLLWKDCSKNRSVHGQFRVVRH